MNVGELAAHFDVLTDTGARFSLASVRGRWVVLWFFPNTESLATDLELAGFKKMTEQFLALKAVVVGISTDSREAHAALRARHRVGFPLCADRSRAISDVYGVLFGLNAFLGLANRQTFLIDPDGRVAHVWRRVQARSHAHKVLEKLEQLEVERRVQVAQARLAQGLLVRGWAL